MDNKGYVIIHNDFVNVSNKTPTVEGIHVTQKVWLFFLLKSFLGSLIGINNLEWIVKQPLNQSMVMRTFSRKAVF